ncbi:hypothetical protein J53TS2_19480 [Paenibacillus sp. J53TS2]|nr:hypothetical protein J53TS2_19480 [Paenibacillus sp. J53TS2]
MQRKVPRAVALVLALFCFYGEGEAALAPENPLCRTLCSIIPFDQKLRQLRLQHETGQLG